MIRAFEFVCMTLLLQGSPSFLHIVHETEKTARKTDTLTLHLQISLWKDFVLNPSVVLLFLS